MFRKVTQFCATLNDRKDAKTVLIVRDGKISIIVAQDAGTIRSTTKEGTPVTVIDLSKPKADRTQIVVPDAVNEVPLELIRPESAPPQQPVSVFVGKAPEPSENTVTEAPAPPQEVKVEQAPITESPLSAIQPIRKIEKSRPKLAQLAEEKIQNNHLKAIFNKPPVRVHIHPGKGLAPVSIAVKQEDGEQLIFVPMDSEVGHDREGHVVVFLPDQGTPVKELEDDQPIIDSNVPIQQVDLEPSADDHMDSEAIITQIGDTFVIRGSSGVNIDKYNKIRIQFPGHHMVAPEWSEDDTIVKAIGNTGKPGHTSQLLQALFSSPARDIIVQPSAGPTTAEVKVEQSDNSNIFWHQRMRSSRRLTNDSPCDKLEMRT